MTARATFSPNVTSICCSIGNDLVLRKHEMRLNQGKYVGTEKYQCVQATLKGSLQAIVDVDDCSLQFKDCIGEEKEESNVPYIQTLRKFPKEDLFGRTVLVRFDSAVVLGQNLNTRCKSLKDALFTVKYLFEAGAKVILVSQWCGKGNSGLVTADSVAGFLSSVLQLKVAPARTISCCGITQLDAFEEADVLLLDNLSDMKEELANDTMFAEKLASGVDIFINDSFSQCHKILGSTVAITRFCYASLAGFQFENSIFQLKQAAETNRKPYVAIIGGGNLYDKAPALQFLASRCEGLVFVGMMAFQIMHALGLAVPSNLVEYGAVKEARDLIQFVQRKNIPIIYPKEFLCMNLRFQDQSQIFPADGILDGWVPVDFGPNSLDEINSLLSRCKKIVWIGPVKFKLPHYNATGANHLVRTLDLLGQSNCNITAIGSAACKEITRSSCSPSAYNMIENATVFWEFLKGRKLPGIWALDRAYPHEIDWSTAYSNPAQPLVVDIGCGNGLFLLEMARRRKDLNFLGLEINHKLVIRCVDSVQRLGIKNGYFIATNATSTFRSIVSTYPGELILVSILCPNPDFDKPEYRWRMVQRSLVEAVADLLKYDGKVFVQSDVKEVATRMKEELLKYGKCKLTLLHDKEKETSEHGWLRENPFGVRSDWEQHAIDRGLPVYRFMLSKSKACP